MKSPILGQSYVARSVNASANRMINLFPEATLQSGQTAGFLNRAPGLRLLNSIGSGPIRGLWSPQLTGQNAYVVSGFGFYKIDTDYVATFLGDVSGTGPVSITDNGTQIFIAANTYGYIYNMTTNVFAQITDPDFAGASTVGFLDGYFVFTQPNSQVFWVTNLLDGSSVEPLNFASAEGSPDDLVGLVVDHREVWLFGTSSVEVWYNAGTVGFPLERIQGAFNEIGCAAAYSIAKLDNGLFWLGSDARGQGIVATWVYDVATDNWHERASFSGGEFKRHRSNCQMSFNNEIIVGDYDDSRIYAFDLNKYSDDTAVQKWLRSWRALPTDTNNLTRTAQHTLQLICESGVGLNDGQGSDPQVMLRWSDDGGHTWSNEHWTSMGKIGVYGARAIWRRLGMTTKLRDRVYEVSGTDPVKIAILGAELNLSGTSA